MILTKGLKATEYYYDQKGTYFIFMDTKGSYMDTMDGVDTDGEMSIVTLGLFTFEGLAYWRLAEHIHHMTIRCSPRIYHAKS
jgi:hypothetical protein